MPGAPTQGRKGGWIGRYVFAHRGLHRDGVPENSPGAFAAAIDAGFGIECDVQRSKDDEAVVFHDWELDRLTAETGPVAQRTAAQLGDVTLAGSSDRIPTLREVLDQIDGRVPLLIELKSRKTMRISPLCHAVHRALEGYDGKYAVMSFDPRVSRWFADRSPETVRGLVVTEEGHRGWSGAFRRRLALVHAQPDFLAYDVRDLPGSFAARQRARGMPIATWTVRTPELRATAARYADAPIAEGAGIGSSS